MTNGWRFDNTYSKLPESFLSNTSPTPVKSPKLLANKLADASNEYFSKNFDWEKRRVASRSHITNNYPLQKMVTSYRTIWES